ncbi:hypothetical protein IT575_03335 [bacterium]|nr:hypothetical protein [bacterium]
MPSRLSCRSHAPLSAVLLRPALPGPVLRILVLCAFALCGLLLIGCGQQGELTRLRRLSADNWRPAQGPGAEQAALSFSVPEGERGCIACHSFTALHTAPNKAEFIAALEPYQRDAAEAAQLEASLSDPASASAQADQAAQAGQSHPGSWLLWHPPEKFGCTACHSGDGAGASLGASGHAAALAVELQLALAGDSDAAVASSPERLERHILRRDEAYARCGSCHSGSYVAGAEQLSQGRRLIRELGCSSCHETSAQLQSILPPGRSKRGPSLARVGEKLSLASLEVWPNQVHELVPSSRHIGMPQYSLSPAESRAIAVFLKGEQHSFGEGPDPLAGAAKGPGPPPRLQEADPQRGLTLLREARCANCHELPLAALPEDDPLRLLPSAGVGPSLVRIGEHVPSEWVELFLANPAAHYPGTRMPQFRLDAGQRRDIAAWLTLASGGPAPQTMTRELPQWYAELDSAGRGKLAADGQRLFAEKGCSGCHDAAVAVSSKAIGPSLLNIGAKPYTALPPAAFEDLRQGRMLSLVDYFSAALSDPLRYGASGAGQGRMPHFRLDDAQRWAIALALAAERPPAAPGAESSAGSSSAASMMPAHQSSAQLFALPLDSPYWPWPIAAQRSSGSAAAGSAQTAWLSSAELSFQPADCGACHRQHYAQWSTSRHARAMSPGITGQLVDWLEEKPAEFYDCMRCHARLSEQLLLRLRASTTADSTSAVQWEHNPDFVAELQASAHGCANCHLRGEVRLGPEKGRAAYLWDSKAISRHPLQREDWLSDSRFCAECHQFPDSQKLPDGGPPLENTYEEWRAWAATQQKPKSCQDCHMPGGEHSFKGIHDALFVRANAQVSSQVRFSGRRAIAELTLRNSNNGHHLPTYVTPRIWLQCFAVDSSGARIDSSFKSAMVGRDARSRRDAAGKLEWYDHADTRIPADEDFTFSYAMELPDNAAALQLEIFVEPDHFYYHAYGDWLKQDWRSPAGKALLELARKETEPFTSGYYLYQACAPVAER